MSRAHETANETERLLTASQQAILCAGLIRRMDLALIQMHVARWDTLAPFLDPTAWRESTRSGHPLGENLRLLKAILPGLQKVQADVTSYLEKLGPEHPLRVQAERELAGETA